MPFITVVAVVVAASLSTLPQTFWQGEEVRFAQSLLTFDPLQQQPEAPGYPLYVAMGRLLNFFVHEPFAALLVLSVLAAAAGAFLTALAAAEILGSEWAGAAAALLLYFSPAMLVFDALPNAEALTVALIAAALLAMIRGKQMWFVVAAAAAIGVRPQLAPAMTILFIASRPCRRAIVFFTIILAIVFAGFADTIGVSRLALYARTSYSMMRTSSEAAGIHGRELLLRFVAHPWGSKWTSFPLLIAAAIGFVILFRRARALAATLAAFLVVHLLVCFVLADRSYGVEPVIPVLIVVAIFAAAAFSRWPFLAILYAMGSVVYVWPLVHVRHTTPSPPARAMRHARRFVPSEAVLLCDPAMEGWGRLSRFEVLSLAEFDRFAHRPDIPLFMAADGGSHMQGAAVFSWPDSDAYGKVTTERYRVVSLIPFPPSARFKSLGGLYSFERTADGREWRWLAGDAVIELPRLGASVVHVRLALPDDAPIDSNVVTVNGTPVTVGRGQTADLAIPTSPLLRIHAARTFTSSKDGRLLAVQLVALEQR